jgi:predicted nucleotidyltransferase
MLNAEAESRRRDGRDAILARAIEVFGSIGAAAIHLFGSTGRGTDDALSDLDLWITVDDNDIAHRVTERDALFARVSPLLIKHEAPQNRPLGGIYSLVIHELPVGLFQVDYYLAPRSTSVILPEARVVYGDDTLPRGRWKLDTSATTPRTLSERIDFLTCMSFVGVKKVLRNDTAFMGFLQAEYREVVATYRLSLEPLPEGASPATIEALLRQLAWVAAAGQQRAISVILDRYIGAGSIPR